MPLGILHALLDRVLGVEVVVGAERPERVVLAGEDELAGVVAHEADEVVDGTVEPVVEGLQSKRIMTAALTT